MQSQSYASSSSTDIRYFGQGLEDFVGILSSWHREAGAELGILPPAVEQDRRGGHELERGDEVVGPLNILDVVAMYLKGGPEEEILRAFESFASVRVLEEVAAFQSAESGTEEDSTRLEAGVDHPRAVLTKKSSHHTLHQSSHLAPDDVSEPVRERGRTSDASQL